MLKGGKFMGIIIYFKTEVVLIKSILIRRFAAKSVVSSGLQYISHFLMCYFTTDTYCTPEDATDSAAKCQIEKKLFDHTNIEIIISNKKN